VAHDNIIPQITIFEILKHIFENQARLLGGICVVVLRPHFERSRPMAGNIS
jgi:hypothetical protein